MPSPFIKPFPIILSLTFLMGCSQPEPTSKTTELPSVEVRVLVVSTDTEPHTQAIAGIVRPVDRATVAANIMGTVTVARLAVGQTVAAGEILVEIKAKELDARLAQARAAWAQADRDHTRESALEAKGAASRESVRSSEDRRRIALAAVQEAEAMMDHLQITAPFSGVITSDFINPGDLATPGQPLFALEGLSHLRAEVLVPESLSAPPIGSPIVIVRDDIRVVGHLVELSPATDPNSRTRLAKIALPRTPAARSGQFVRALWPIGEFTSLAIPADALSVFGQMERIYVVTEGRAQLRIIKTGAPQGDRVQITAGLESGETVIIAPPSTLRDGQPVEIIK